MVNVVNEVEEIETLIKHYREQADHPRDAINSAIDAYEEDFGSVTEKITQVNATSGESPRTFRITIIGQPI